MKLALDRLFLSPSFDEVVISLKDESGATHELRLDADEMFNLIEIGSGAVRVIDVKARGRTHTLVASAAAVRNPIADEDLVLDFRFGTSGCLAIAVPRSGASALASDLLAVAEATPQKLQ
jgi:hypothetical protein